MNKIEELFEEFLDEFAIMLNFLAIRSTKKGFDIDLVVTAADNLASKYRRKMKTIDTTKPTNSIFQWISGRFRKSTITNTNSDLIDDDRDYSLNDKVTQMQAEIFSIEYNKVNEPTQPIDESSIDSVNNTIEENDLTNEEINKPNLIHNQIEEKHTVPSANPKDSLLITDKL
ncbi:MAG: hypothetical protein OEZ01_17085, partial [Candidatus Heimdallarchaeota archaeon]|nr:hypothetical protein [Candidatus Heimdallarchaeota archaeon]